jgi:hypothetical protein
MALIQRLLTFRFTKAQGTFKESSTDTVEVSGLRATAKIVKAGTPSLGEAQLQIYGMTLSLMNQLSTLGMVFSLIPRDSVTVLAGDDSTGLSVVFYGTIVQAWGDFASAPDVPFHIQAHTLGTESAITGDPQSFTGPVDAAGVMKNLADKMGLTFENNGVSVTLPRSYFYGSLRAQADQCATAAGIQWFADDKKLAIWPTGKARDGDPVLVSDKSGMVGYPSFVAFGIQVRTLFNPKLRFGGTMTIDSILPAANKTWNIINLAHDLATLFPGGDWYSTVGGFDPRFTQPAVLK